jgi:hypothetical protein
METIGIYGPVKHAPFEQETLEGRREAALQHDD